MSAKILLVDDDRLTLKNVARLLRDEGYEVAEARDGIEATKRLQGDEYGLVLSDLMMPGINGLELLAHARSFAPGVPVLIMSGFPAVDPEEIIGLGARGFIAKPLALDDLLSEVRRALEPQTTP